MNQVEGILPAEDHAEWPLIAKKLSKTYINGASKFVAVNDLTLGVKKGSIVGLLGPNGAGKSTAFSMFAMQAQRTAGNVHLIG